MGDSSAADELVELVPSQTIHRCMAYIWERLHLRARLFLLEERSLVLRDFVGEYRCCPEIGLKVHPESIVWEIFREGKAVNLAEAPALEKRPHTLPEPVPIKAVIPLKAGDPRDGVVRRLGVLVVDFGEPNKPIEDRDFHYLQILGTLISQILQGSILLSKLRKIQNERERSAREIAHIVRNRLIVIGGFARRLVKVLPEPQWKGWAEVILQESEGGEEALKQWRNAHDQEAVFHWPGTE
jgi:hypothetical protein